MPSAVPDAAGNNPAGGAKPDEATIPKAGDAVAKTAHWTPPKRYHFVMDAFTGLALGGNDPVAFFVDGTVRLGNPDHETDWGGTTWHFLNEGNLAAFKQNPEVYAPQFGGRCAYALSQGLLVEGQPQFFLLYRDRLYLFANAGYRAAFLTNPDAFLAEDKRVWPDLTRGEP
jgi:YHS domain-containing protein